MDDRKRELSTLARWHLRFQRALGFWKDPSERFADIDLQFNYLVESLVAATYFEGLLFIGVQFVGADAKSIQRKTFGTLIEMAEKRGLIDATLTALLKAVSKIRNGFAHDPDHTLDRETVDALYDLLPDDRKASLQPAFASVVPEPTQAVISSLTYEQIGIMTYEAVMVAVRRAVEAGD